MQNLVQFVRSASLFVIAVFSYEHVAFASPVETGVWGKLPDGREVKIFTLENADKTRVMLAEYGALLVSVETVDKEGRIADVTLSYRTLDEALAGGVFGSVIGRFANRIDGGGFSIDGRRYDLESVNSNGIHSHGGKTGFHRQLWKGEADGATNSVTFHLMSPDGHEGYPGRVDVSVRYSLSEENVLRLAYTGSTDQPTHLNLTNHVYFNLAGRGEILEHRLRLSCPQVLALDSRMIPTGEIVDVANTPFDFRREKALGLEIREIPVGGYDHCFLIPKESRLPKSFARLSDPESGRVLEVATTLSGVQIYSGNFLKGDPFPRWGGVCFETQFYPDTPNHPEFPSSLLRPGQTYHQTTEFRFSTEP